MPELPSGTLTVLHTESEGSTLLTVHLRDRYPDVLATHRALLRAAFAVHEGREVDTQGDSFFVVFPRAMQAVATAVAIQRALVAEAWPEGGAVRVVSASTQGNRSGRRKGTRGWTSSVARASGTPATVGKCCCRSRPPP
jgi:class 3 adenylate cyclase